MSYRLVIAEKPSVGAAYAKVLGATNRQDGYWEGNGYLVSWCIGHLVELAPPNVYDEKYVKWSVADLPILPKKWQYLVSASTKKQFGILKKLMNRPDAVPQGVKPHLGQRFKGQVGSFQVVEARLCFFLDQYPFDLCIGCAVDVAPLDLPLRRARLDVPAFPPTILAFVNVFSPSCHFVSSCGLDTHLTTYFVHHRL